MGGCPSIVGIQALLHIPITAPESIPFPFSHGTRKTGISLLATSGILHPRHHNCWQRQFQAGLRCSFISTAVTVVMEDGRKHDENLIDTKFCCLTALTPDLKYQPWPCGDTQAQEGDASTVLPCPCSPWDAAASTQPAPEETNTASVSSGTGPWPPAQPAPSPPPCTHPSQTRHKALAAREHPPSHHSAAPAPPPAGAQAWEWGGPGSPQNMSAEPSSTHHSCLDTSSSSPSTPGWGRGETLSLWSQQGAGNSFILGAMGCKGA